MNSNTNPRHNSNVDPQLFINCVFDMDYLEVTKNESLRKYEENVYLLGTIFSNKIKSDELSEESSDSESDDSILEDEIINLFDSKNKDSQENVDKFNLIKSKIESEIFSNKETPGSTEPQSLYDHFNLTLNDFQETQNQLKEFNNSFKNETATFSDIVTKLRTSKNLENELEEIMASSEKIGIISSTFKQTSAYNHTLKNYHLSKNLPWDPEKNIVIYNIES